MAFVRVEQRNAHLAGPVRLHTVAGREGPISKATLTAISNTRRGGRSGREEGDDRDSRAEEPTAIQWTLWGKQADNAVAFLGKGSHVNVVGRVQNNNYDKDGETVYSLTFTADEIDYLDTKVAGDSLRARQGASGAGNASDAPDAPDAAEVAEVAGTESRPANKPKPLRTRKAVNRATANESADAAIPF